MGTKKYPGILAIKGRDRNLKGRMSGGKVVNTKKPTMAVMLFT